LRDAPLPQLHPTLYADGTRHIINPRIGLDTYGGNRIDIHTTVDWPGHLPAKLYSTVTAILLAWRGVVPLHGSAVEVDGKAILVCGHSGVGKSTTVASLLAAGGRLLSDDLTVLHPQPGNHPSLVFAGRRGLRLFASTARFLGESVAWESLPHVSAGKIAVYPPSVDPHRAVPLAAVIVLEDGPSPEDMKQATKQRAALLEQQVFRPLAMRLVPGVSERRSALAQAASSLPVGRLPRIDLHERHAFHKSGERVLDYLAIRR
jgi:hypothetical protein